MSNYYDYPLIEHRLNAMRKHAKNKDIDSMTLALRAGIFPLPLSHHNYVIDNMSL